MIASPARHAAAVSLPYRFALQIAWFWVPVFLCLAAIEAVLWVSGETWPVERVVRYQQAHQPALFLRGAMGQAFQPYKLYAAAHLRPRVMALGSSRAMQFRSEIFGAESFYNAGGSIQSLDDLDAFFRLLPADAWPRVVLLGVDVWWFNGNLQIPVTDLQDDPARSWAAHLTVIQKLARRPGMLRELLIGLRHPRAIGIAAGFSGAGFRADGSMYYKLPLPPPGAPWEFVDHEDPPIPVRLRETLEQFQPAARAAPERLARLAAILQRLRRAGVTVIGFAPPFSSASLAILENDPRHRGLWTDFRRAMPPLFARFDFPWYDGSSTAALGIDDRYLFDGFHGSETFQLYLLRALLRDPRVRAALPEAEPAVELCLGSPGLNYWYLGREVSRATVFPASHTR